MRNIPETLKAIDTKNYCTIIQIKYSDRQGPITLSNCISAGFFKLYYRKMNEKKKNLGLCKKKSNPQYLFKKALNNFYHCITCCNTVYINATIIFSLDVLWPSSSWHFQNTVQISSQQSFAPFKVYFYRPHYYLNCLKSSPEIILKY